MADFVGVDGNNWERSDPRNGHRRPADKCDFPQVHWAEPGREQVPHNTPNFETVSAPLTASLGVRAFGFAKEGLDGDGEDVHASIGIEKVHALPGANCCIPHIEAGG